MLAKVLKWASLDTRNATHEETWTLKTQFRFSVLQTEGHVLLPLHRHFKIVDIYNLASVCVLEVGKTDITLNDVKQSIIPLNTPSCSKQCLLTLYA